MPEERILPARPCRSWLFSWREAVGCWAEEAAFTAVWKMLNGVGMALPGREGEVEPWLGGELSSPVHVGPKRASHLSRITQQFGARPGLQPRCVSLGCFALQLFWGGLERVGGRRWVSAAPWTPGPQHTQWVVLPSPGRRVQGWQSPGWGRPVFASLMLCFVDPQGSA